MGQNFLCRFFRGLSGSITLASGQASVCISGSRPEVWRPSLQQRWDSPRGWGAKQTRQPDIVQRGAGFFWMAAWRGCTSGGCYGCCWRGLFLCTRVSDTWGHFHAWPGLRRDGQRGDKLTKTNASRIYKNRIQHQKTKAQRTNNDKYVCSTSGNKMNPLNDLNSGWCINAYRAKILQRERKKKKKQPKAPTLWGIL